MIVYVESSAAVKLLVNEAETPALVEYLNSLLGDPQSSLVSGTILETELRRAAVRVGAPQTQVTAILDRVDIVDLDRSVFTSAGTLPGPNVRSLDALHIAAALKVNAGLMISYDARQVSVAGSAGLRTLSPA